MGRSDSSEDSLGSRDSSRKHKKTGSSKSKKKDRRKDSKDRSKGYHKESSSKRRTRSSDSEDSSYVSKSRYDKDKDSSSKSKSSRSISKYDNYGSSSSRKNRSRSNSRERGRKHRKSSYDRKDKEYKGSRSGGSSRKKRRSSSRSSSSSITSRSSSSENSYKKQGSNSKPKGFEGKESSPRNLTSAALLARIEEKLDLSQQVNRLNDIEEIENAGFAPKSFKTSRAPKAENIPLPPLELKPVNLSNLKNEILCHPSLIMSQKEREEQWIKRLFTLRQKLFASDGEKISNFE